MHESNWNQTLLESCRAFQLNADLLKRDLKQAILHHCRGRVDSTVMPSVRRELESDGFWKAASGTPKLRTQSELADFYGISYKTFQRRLRAAGVKFSHRMLTQADQQLVAKIMRDATKKGGGD